MGLTTSSVILFQCLVVFCKGINPSTILNLGGSYDTILQGHSYELWKVKTLEQCHRICLYSPKCLSVNWNVKTKYCHLNSADVCSGTPLMMSTGDMYVPALNSNTQNHACVPSPCRYGEVCIPVTATTSFVCLRPDIGTYTSTTFSTTDSTTTAAPTTAATTTTSTTTTATTTTTTPTPTTTTTTTTTTSTPQTTQDLSQYSDSFTRIQGYVVWLLNNKTYTSVSSVSTCQEYCVQHTAFTCKSYEYYYAERWCFLQSFVKDDALSVWTADSRGDYFERLRFSELDASSQP